MESVFEVIPKIQQLAEQWRVSLWEMDSSLVEVSNEK